MDTTQLMLSAVLAVSTILLIVVGLQLIFLIRDTRRTLSRVNAILDEFEKVGSSLDAGLGEMRGFLGGIKALFKIIDLFHSKRHAKSK